MRRLGGSMLAALFFIFGSAHADDWPQWMGPGRDELWKETGVLEKFPSSGARIAWRTPIAGGYAGPAVAGGKVFVADYVKEEGDASNDPGRRAELRGKERFVCLDAADGKVLWRHEYPCNYKISYPAGPRATPTVDGDKVYCLGAEGNLFCLDVESGKSLWSKDLKKEYKIDAPLWGFCGHPLVDGDKLVCLVGGQGSVLVAFDKNSGKELWKSLTAPEPGYCPPSIVTVGSTRQLLLWHPLAVNSVNPETGELFWSVPLEPNYGMSIMAPRLEGDVLFASGIHTTAAALKLNRDKPAAEVLWRAKNTEAVFCANATPIIVDGIIYGCDCDKGCFRAVQLKDGKRLWETFAPTTGDKRAKHGTAFCVQNGDRYYLFSETGDLIVARLSKEKYEEVSRAHVIEPTGEAFGRPVVWSHPAYADRAAFVRNDKEIIRVSLARE